MFKQIRPDVVFLDIMMPEISGIDVLIQVRNYYDYNSNVQYFAAQGYQVSHIRKDEL